MRPASHRLLLACLTAALALAVAGCTNTKLGNETTGRNIDSEYGYRVQLISPSDRKPGPEAAGKGLDGKPVALSDLSGSVSVVNFWASWCNPCRNEESILVRVANANEAKGVKFLGVNIRDTIVNANAFREEFGVTFPSIFNPDSSIAAKFRLVTPPSTFVLDRQGRIAARIIGAASNEAELQRLIDEVLEA